ncbi:MAG: sulfotransferase [Pseudomonadota bacterium]
MEVPTSLYWHSWLAQKCRLLWLTLSSIETRVLQEELREIEVRQPIYIAGLARSGSTILLEILNDVPQTASHRYCDFPYLFTPYWTYWMQRRLGVSGSNKTERAHADRLQVSQTSPEAMEEVLWMHFFPGLHDRGAERGLVDLAIDNGFAQFYREHIQKLLLARGESRYLAKGNYNLGRLERLLSLFPDARFLVPVRRPVEHIASLVKQQQLFQRATTENPKVAHYLSWVGHFEFGIYRQPMAEGDSAAEIRACWREGDEVRGWALTWRNAYESVAARCSANPTLAKQTFFVRYEDLCRDSEQTLALVLAHCDLDPRSLRQLSERYAQSLTFPDYYRPSFTAAELAVIDEVCGPAAARFGY